MGDSDANAEAGPGDQDVPLTLTIQYVYPYTAQFAQVNVALPAGFHSTSYVTSPQSGTNATLYYTNKLLQGQVFQVQTFLDLAKNVSLGKYSLPRRFSGARCSQTPLTSPRCLWSRMHSSR